VQVALEDGTQIGGGFVLRAVQRFDLTPIPSTLELTLRADATLPRRGGLITEGTVLLAGATRDRYRVVKLRRAPSERLQGPSDPAEALEVTALLDGLEMVARRRDRAVVKEGRSMGEVYRACGATCKIGQDIAAVRFACMVGQFPTVGIAQALQEEGAVALWRLRGELAFVRIADLFQGKPAESVAADTTVLVQSDFIEQHEIPAGMSTKPDGSVSAGRRAQPNGWIYVPRASSRVLENLSKCLVVRRTAAGAYAGHLRAGDGIDVAGVRHVIATAAHSWAAGAAGEAPVQMTRLWLAQLSR
jgi:hypothetical protein